MRPRLIHVVQHLAPGGLEMLVLELHRHYGATVDLHVVSLEGNVDDIRKQWPQARTLGARLHAMGKKPGLSPFLIPRLAALFLDLEPDAVHTHHIGPLIYGGLAARLAGCARVLHTEHDAWHLHDPRRRRVEELALKLVRPRIIAAGRAVANGLKGALPGHTAEVVANAVDTVRFCPGDRFAARRKLGLPLPVTLIGCAGRLTAVKGHDLLIDAAYRLPPHVHVAIAGDGPLRGKLALQARDLGLADRVHFLGHVAEMEAFYQAIELFCLPSRAEGLPLAVLEAQACGVRVVAANLPGVAEALCPLTSEVVTTEDAHALAVGIRRALATKLVGSSPRPFVEARHTMAKLAEAYRALALA